MKLNAKQLRRAKVTENELGKISRRPIYIVLDNILDTFNIGSIFRLADAISAEKIYICGNSETPPNHRITKASVNTWQWVPWEYRQTALAAIKELKKNIPGLKVIAIEQTSKSRSYEKINYSLPLALVLGHETTGISKKALALSDRVAHLPMLGVNRSLNVVVALAIVGYKILEVTAGKPGNI